MTEYIVEVHDIGETLEYVYSDYVHARLLFDIEHLSSILWQRSPDGKMKLDEKRRRE